MAAGRALEGRGLEKISTFLVSGISAGETSRIGCGVKKDEWGTFQLETLCHIF